MGTLDQQHYRFRNDDGTEVTATGIAATDTAASVVLNRAFRLRIGLHESSGSTITALNYLLQFRRNSGTWTNLNFYPFTAVGVFDCSPVDGIATTQQITSGSFLAGFYRDLAGGFFTNFFANGVSEFEWGLSLAHPLARPGDLLEFRVAHNDSPTYSPIDTYTVIPALTVQRTTRAPTSNHSNPAIL